MINMTWLLLMLLAANLGAAGLMSPVPKDEKAPSREHVLWTQTDVGYNMEATGEYVGRAPIDFGGGRRGHIEEQVTDFRHVFVARELMAFLFHGGAQWNRVGFTGVDSAEVLLPNAFHTVNMFLAADFRWSTSHMVRLQLQPGLYSDLNDISTDDLNMPMAIAYTHIPNKRFQWAIGLSINTWRDTPVLPGGGFRYYINDKWKLKLMLPTPQIEYRAGKPLHLFVGADFRGDTYRVSNKFGSRKNVQTLNNALVNYQEIRLGAGFSWNIRPLIALQGTTGWMFDREFDYFNTGHHSSGRGAPYVGLNLKALWQLKKDARPIPAQLRSMQYEFPTLQKYFKMPQ
jgi:hypothetical protein